MAEKNPLTIQRVRFGVETSCDYSGIALLCSIWRPPPICVFENSQVSSSPLLNKQSNRWKRKVEELEEMLVRMSKIYKKRNF